MKRSAHEVRREQIAKVQARPFRSLFDLLAQLSESGETGPAAAQQVREKAFRT